jgi:quercetin dioxygenase-like cupin family protein
MTRSRYAIALAMVTTMLAFTACTHTKSQETTSTEKIMNDTPQVSRQAEREIFQGTPDKFTGQVQGRMFFTPNEVRDFSSATVSFQPGARTAWHTHPAGQTLVITEGVAWVQIEGDERITANAGDVVWIPPNTRHWHGATSEGAMTHIATQGVVNNEVVTWLELVTDAQYAPSSP